MKKQRIDYDIHISPKVFNKVYRKHLNNLNDVQIIYGGSSSGKSVFVAKRCVTNVLKGGRNYLVCRQVGRTIRKSVFNEIKKAITDFGVLSLFTINQTDLVITCVNGYQILFGGLDDTEKLKSITPEKGVVTDIWVEEATEIEKASFVQLTKRLRGGEEETQKTITLTFNPILQNHWIYKEWFEAIAWTDTQTEFENDEYSILKTTYKDNRFLTKQDIKNLENEKDSYYYNVYTLGNWGILGHVIFTNWIQEDLSGMLDQFTNPRHGQDFGYSSDPAATAVSHYDSKKKIIYVYDEGYETGLTNDMLAANLKEKIGFDRIGCDSAEPKSVADLQKYGVNAYSVKKGKDSVLHGIQWLQQQTIIVDSRCINMRNELSQYKWKEDAGGNALSIPVDKNNHLIDALRYAYEEDMDYSGWLAL